MIKKIKLKIQSYASNEHFYEIVKGAIYSSGANILVKAIGIITSVIAARYYGAEMVGLMALLLSVIVIAGLFSTFGLTTAMLRLVPEYSVKYSEATSIAVYKRIRNLVIAITLIVSALLYLLSGVIANSIYNQPNLEFYIVLASILLVFSSLNSVNTTMLRTLKKIKLYAWLELFPKIISAMLLLVLTFVFYNQFNLMYVVLIPPVLMSVWLIYYMRSVVSRPRGEVNSNVIPSSKDILVLASPMLMVSGMNVIMGQTDIVMIGIFEGASQVGIYSIVLSLVSMLSFVLVSMNVMVAPKISELYHSERHSELANVVQRSSKLIFWLTFPVVVFLIGFGQYILAIFGTEFEAGYYALVILLVAQFFNAMTGSVGNVLNMTGYQKELRNIVFTSAVLNVVLNLILLPVYGIEGAAVASLISMTFLNVVSVWLVKKKLRFYTFYFPGFKV